MLYGVVHEHLRSFLALAEGDECGSGLPRFVEQELRGFLDCGLLQKGFARFRCAGCGHDRLVAFSCKGRGFCPSCGGKRMTQLASHLVDHVIPIVPTRQYVLSLPHALRKRLAYDHAAQKRVVSIFARALLDFHCRRARERGIDNGQGGAVTFVQRFGSALNLNLHLHTQALDGVFTEAPDGSLRFHKVPPPSTVELRVLLSVVRHQVLSDAAEHGLLLDDAAPDIALDSPALAAFIAASADNQPALRDAQTPLQRTLSFARCRPKRQQKKHRLAVHYDGFDLHAGLTVPARRRKTLERILRYCARPALSHDRLQRLADGRVRLALKTPWADGTTHLTFEPLEFIGRLSALIPFPHKNLLIYHGVLAPRATWRSRAVVYGRPLKTPQPDSPTPAGAPQHPTRRSAWATLMQRAFAIDVLACPRCGGRLKLIARITQPRVIRRILEHLGLPADVAEPPLARAPPWQAPADDYHTA